MHTSKLKDILIQRIQATDDVTFLKNLKMLTDKKNSRTYYELSELEKKKIEEARKQIKNGDTFTQKEVFDEIDVWLNGK